MGIRYYYLHIKKLTRDSLYSFTDWETTLRSLCVAASLREIFLLDLTGSSAGMS